MKASTFLSALFLGAACAAPGAETSTKVAPCKRAKCNADNCARAVTGTRLGAATQTAQKADCSSFLQCTAYPATSTVTATATVYPATQTATVFPQTVVDSVTYTTIASTVTTVTQVQTAQATSIALETVVQTIVSTFQPAQRRAATTKPASANVVCPTQVPTYASACSGTVRFSSACSCWGVSSTTTTMTTPTTTVTVTATGKTTITMSNTQVVTTSVAAVTDVAATNTVTTTVVNVVTVPTTVQQVSVVTASPVANAYCENGQGVNGLTASCTNAACQVVNMRIEGAEGTVYEGLIRTGPTNVTTPSGGTHLCDGTNNGANPVPGPNGIGAIASGATLCGYTFDGTYSNSFQDFFINRIGASDSNAGSNRYWGILRDYQFTPAGGCESEYSPTEDLLWAYDAFNANAFLKVEPTRGTVVLTPGQTHTFTVTDGMSGNNIGGASFGGQTSDSNGQVTYTAPSTPGVYRLKATKAGTIRSNAVVVVVQG